MIVIEGILKFNGNKECIGDWTEQAYINISNAKGYEQVRKSRDGERHREWISMQHL